MQHDRREPLLVDDFEALRLQGLRNELAVELRLGDVRNGSGSRSNADSSDQQCSQGNGGRTPDPGFVFKAGNAVFEIHGVPQSRQVVSAFWAYPRAEVTSTGFHLRPAGGAFTLGDIRPEHHLETGDRIDVPLFLDNSQGCEHALAYLPERGTTRFREAGSGLFVSGKIEDSHGG